MKKILSFNFTLMAQVYVTPNEKDSGASILAIGIFIVAVIFLIILAYANGWFRVQPSTESPSTNSDINITIPPPNPANPNPVSPNPPSTSLPRG